MKILPNVLELAGVACIVVGAAMLAVWAAWVVAGIGLIGAAVAMELRS